MTTKTTLTIMRETTTTRATSTARTTTNFMKVTVKVNMRAKTRTQRTSAERAQVGERKSEREGTR